jgi:hypothetical protein
MPDYKDHRANHLPERLAGLLAVVAWSFAFVGYRDGVQQLQANGLNPLAAASLVVFYRFLISLLGFGTLFLLGKFWSARRPAAARGPALFAFKRLKRADVRRFLLFAFFGTTWYHIALAWIESDSAGIPEEVAAAVNLLVPIGVLLIKRLMSRETPPDWREFAWMALGLGGAWLVLYGERPTAAENADSGYSLLAWSVLLTIPATLAAYTWSLGASAIGEPQAGSLTSRYGAVNLTAQAFALGTVGVFLVLMGLAAGGQLSPEHLLMPLTMGNQMLDVLLILGLVSTTLGYTLWSVAVGSKSAGAQLFARSAFYLLPLLTALSRWLRDGSFEVSLLTLTVGTLMLFISYWMVNRVSSKRLEPSPPLSNSPPGTHSAAAGRGPVPSTQTPDSPAPADAAQGVRRAEAAPPA